MTNVPFCIHNAPSSARDEMTQDDSPYTLAQCYDELRTLAQARLGKLPPGQTLQATALVHEVWMRLEDQGQGGAEDRRLFFLRAGQAMRDILVEAVRRRSRLKRGGDRQRADQDPDQLSNLEGLEISVPVEDILALDELLDRLSASYARPAEVVMLKWFSGLEHEEIAEILDTSVRTVERDWRFAKAWLYEGLERTRGDGRG